jgi:hypothetical protein
VFKPSGSLVAGMKELVTKSKRAYHSISNRHPCGTVRGRALGDTELSCCLLSVIMKTWESFHPETVNQKLCRLLLSCHKKSSRLVMLGEFGRYLLLIKALVQTIKYKWSLFHSSNTLVTDAVSEMYSMGIDNWLYCVNQVGKLFNISIHPKLKTADIVGQYVKKKKLNSNLTYFGKSEISCKKTGLDGVDHNKLRFYSTLKSSSCFFGKISSVSPGFVNLSC